MRCLDAVVFRSLVPKGAALVTHATFVPGVGGDVHILSDSGADDKSMLGAVLATVVEVAWVLIVGIVVEHEEVILRPVADILREMRIAEGIIVGRQWHKEDAIVCICPASLFLCFIGPLTA